jgi:ribosome hibernation promoting factor
VQISTTARHCEFDPELRLFAQKRLEKLGRFARDLMEAHLIITAEGYRTSAEITLKLKRREMVSREESTVARAAIDRAAARLEQQLRRLKEKRVSRKRGAAVLNGRIAATSERDGADAGDGAAGGD